MNYEFLLALAVGESYKFENKPTLKEARRKASPSTRSAYARISTALVNLRRLHPDHHFKLSLSESKGSRIAGNIIVVTLLARGEHVASDDDLRNHERLRQRSLEAWKRRKQAEDAPKLPGQIEEARAVDIARRTLPRLEVCAWIATG